MLTMTDTIRYIESNIGYKFRDIEIDLPVYMIEVTDENKVMDSVKLNEVGYELDTHLAGDPVVLKTLGIK